MATKKVKKVVVNDPGLVEKVRRQEADLNRLNRENERLQRRMASWQDGDHAILHDAKDRAQKNLQDAEEVLVKFQQGIRAVADQVNETLDKVADIGAGVQHNLSLSIQGLKNFVSDEDPRSDLAKSVEKLSQMLDEQDAVIALRDQMLAEKDRLIEVLQTTSRQIDLRLREVFQHGVLGQDLRKKVNRVLPKGYLNLPKEKFEEFLKTGAVLSAQREVFVWFLNEEVKFHRMGVEEDPEATQDSPVEAPGCPVAGSSDPSAVEDVSPGA